MEGLILRIPTIPPTDWFQSFQWFQSTMEFIWISQFSPFLCINHNLSLSPVHKYRITEGISQWASTDFIRSTAQCNPSNVCSILNINIPFAIWIQSTMFLTRWTVTRYSPYGVYPQIFNISRWWLELKWFVPVNSSIQSKRPESAWSIEWIETLDKGHYESVTSPIVYVVNSLVFMHFLAVDPYVCDLLCWVLYESAFLCE